MELFLKILFITLVIACAVTIGHAGEKPNVVVMMVDNLGWGEIGAYETLVDRARREAVLRMKERSRGADIIVNVRIETSAIGKTAENRNTVGSIEAIAYGTAVTLRK